MPLIILTITLYPIRLGFYYFTYAQIGANAIWLSFPVAAFSSLALMAWAYYRSGWREKALAETAGEAAEQANAEGEPAGRSNPTM
jgi:Na+-driven multidrug efflux pump